MSLDDEQIQECLQRYLREYDRYSKMAEIVYQKRLEIDQIVERTNSPDTHV